MAIDGTLHRFHRGAVHGDVWTTAHDLFSKPMAGNIVPGLEPVLTQQRPPLAGVAWPVELGTHYASSAFIQ